jgi:hypothetical protein
MLIPEWVELEKGDQALGLLSEDNAAAMGQVLVPYMGPVVLSAMVQAAEEVEEIKRRRRKSMK